MRALGKKATKALARHLRPNQRACFEASVRALRRERARLIERLGLPPEAEWPAPRTTPCLAQVTDDDAPPSAPPAAVRPRRDGRPVLRLRHDVSDRRLVIGALVATGPATALFEMNLVVHALALMFAGAVIG